MHPILFLEKLLFQGSIYNWVRLHRLHHKKFGTPEDPLYSAKDFFSAHVRAQLENLSPQQEKDLEEIDMKDMEEDKIVMFQKR